MLIKLHLNAGVGIGIWLLLMLCPGWAAHAADPPNHAPRMFYDQNFGMLYLPQRGAYALDLRLLYHLDEVRTSGRTQDKEFSENTWRVAPGTPDSLFRLPEGPTEFGATLSDGRRLSQQVFVDGTPPGLSLRLEAESFAGADTLYYGPPQALRFEAFDEASGLEQIWVSVNDSPFMPHQEAEALMQPEGFYALRFYAVDRVGNVSEMQQTSFVLDLSPPQLEMSSRGNSFENRLSRASAFLLSAGDARAGLARIFYRIYPRGSATAEERFAIYDDEVPVSLQQLDEGRYTLEAFAADRVGLHSDTLRYDFVIDDTPPVLRAEVGAPAFEKSGTRYISAETPVRLHAEDALSEVQKLHFSINTSPEKIYEQHFTLQSQLSELLSGLYSISYRAVDAVNNESSTAIFRAFLDTNPPEVSYFFEGQYTGEATAGSYSLSGETLVSLQAEDLETGVANIEYQLMESGDDEAPAAWQSYEHAVQPGPPGLYQLAFRAADAVENVSETTRLQLQVRETGDFASAGSSPSLPQAEKAYFREASEAGESARLIGPLSENVYIFISDSPEADGMQLLLSDTPQPQGAARQLPAEGRQHIRMDIGTGEMQFQLTTDGTPPQTRLQPSETPQAQSEEGIIFNTDVRFRLQSSDNIAGLEDLFYSIDGQEYQSYGEELSGFVAQKAYVLRYYAIDRAGNKEPVQEFGFTIDATPPRSRLELLSDFSGSTVSPQTRWAIRSKDNIAGVDTVYFRFNDEAQWQAYEGPLAFSTFVTGERITENTLQQLHYYAVDEVGNAETPRQFSFRLQTRPPELSYSWRGAVVERDEVYIAHPDARLQLYATPGNVPVRTLRYGFSTNAMQLYDDKAALQLPRGGTGRIFFEAEDETGNVSRMHRLDFLSDAIPPRTRHRLSGPLLESRTGLVLGPGHELRLEAQDEGAGVAQTRLRINEGGWQSYRDAITLGQSGSYTLSYASADAVGNEEQPRRLSFRVDVTPPDIDVIYSRPPLQRRNDGVIRLAPGTAIAANATDRHTEISTLHYSIDDGPRQQYAGPLREWPENTVFSLHLVATDLAGNTARQHLRFIVETTE